MARTKRSHNPVRSVAVVPEAPKQRVYNAMGYARLSDKDSGRPGADTIEEQQRLICEYIEGQSDMRFCGVLSDNGRTGTNFERPGFEQLMEAVRTGKVDCIVVKDLSRFGRNYLEADQYIERVFPFLGVRFIAVNDGFDTLTAERNSDGYIVPLKNIINDAYSKDISRKIIPALAGKQQRGEFIGAWAAYGYRKCANDGHRIEPDKETAPVVKKIFEWRAAGMSYQQIARTLNELAIPSPSRYLYMTGIAKTEKYAKTVWNISNVKSLLRNGVYCGDMVQGRRRSALSEGLKDKYLPKEEWTVVPNTHEALIDADTFAIVQRMAEERKKAYHERIGKFEYLGTTPNILRGLIFCADCKRPLVRYKSVTNKGTNRYYVWICQSHSNDPASCPKKYLHETELIGILWDILRREIALASEMEAAVRRYSKSQAAQRREHELEHEEADARQALDRASMFYESLYANYVAELLTEQEYGEMKQQYRGEIARAKERLEAIEQQRKALDTQTVGNPWMKSFSRFREATELTGDMAHALIERVEVNAENGIEVKLRYRNEYRELLLAVTEAVPA